MIDLSHLTAESTLGYLPLDDCQVEKDVPAYMVADRFAQNPHLVGVLVCDQTSSHPLKLLGIISRQKFLEEMGRIYGRDLYLKKPIEVLFSVVGVDPLMLPDTFPVERAANQALNRPSDRVFEPVVVYFRDHSLRLLDTHVLLLAQSHVLGVVNRMVQQQKLELQQYLVKLREEQTKTTEINRLLEIQQISIRDRNRLLEEQKAELLQKSQEITDLNQRIVQIGQILSKEGKEAFQATFAGINTISQNTNDVIVASKTLSGELESIRESFKLIHQASDLANTLSKQASVLANQFGSDFAGISRVTSDIGDLSRKTSKANHQIEQIGDRLKKRIGDLTKLANKGTGVVQSLLQKVSRAEVVLTELETLISQQVSQPESSSAQSEPEILQDDARILAKKIERLLKSSKLKANQEYGGVGSRGE